MEPVIINMGTKCQTPNIHCPFLDMGVVETVFSLIKKLYNLCLSTSHSVYVHKRCTVIFFFSTSATQPIVGLYFTAY